jgi:hypothetical protein
MGKRAREKKIENGKDKGKMTKGRQDMFNIPFIMVFLIIMSTPAYSFDNEITHRDLTKNAIEKSNLNKYLIDNLELKGGFEANIKGRSVIQWLREGAYSEDKPACRAANHFHDPLKPWDQSYMSDDTTPLASAIRYYCEQVGWPYVERKSNITWATAYISRDGPKYLVNVYSSTSLTAPYNWDAARGYYYEALTSKNSADRENYFANAFKTVGHVLHLLQDMAVPAHTRNDFQSHLIKNNNSFFDRIQPFENYVRVNSGLAASANPSNNFPSFANPHLTDFWDTNLYDGSNPSDSLSIGLAEFSNANYLSDYTIPNDSPSQEHAFPFPVMSSATYQTCHDLEPSSPVLKRKYISRKSKGPCPPISNERAADHFAVVSFLDEDNGDLSSLTLWLDDNVHNTYAKELLPRAVGYSAGLLNYFFRGTLEITAPDQCVYSLIDGAGTQEFTKIKAKVMNTSYIKDQAGNNISFEEIKSGALQAIARYKIRTDYLPDMSNDPPVDSSYGTDFSYSVSSSVTLNETDIAALNSETPKEFTFNFTSSPIPAGITDLYLQVVFKGTLGNETDNAIAVGFKDLSEPTHINLWNTTDQTYFAGHLIPSTESNRVTINERIAFCPTSGWPPQDANDYQVQYMPMEPGQFGRIMFISDPGIQIFYGVTDTPVNDPNPTVANDWYLPWTTVYQDGIVGDNTHVYEFRGKAFHEASGYYNPAVSVPDAGFWLADWPTTVNDAIPAANLNW